MFHYRYLKVVDKFNDQSVSAFVTASQSVLVLLHEGKHEDTVKAFFNDVYELYIKVLGIFFCFELKSCCTTVNLLFFVPGTGSVSGSYF